MKLAFCLYNYFPYGGLQRDFLRIARACHGRGHEIHVFCMSWEGEQPSGFNIQLLPARGFTNHGRCRSFVRAVAGKLAAGCFDAVIGFNKMPGLDVYFAADPCFVAKATDEKSPLYRLTGRYRVYSAMERAVFGKGSSTKILLLNGGEKQKFIRCYQTPDARFHLLPPGIDSDEYQLPNAGEVRGQLRSHLGMGEDDLLLLMVGSGFKTKGVDRSVRALASLPNEVRRRAFLCVAGRGNPAPFMALANDFGISSQVSFLGTRDDVPELLAAADLLLHPSYTEAAGMVLLESMLSGLPILCTEVCGYAFHVEAAGAGLLIREPFRQESMDALLLRMLISPGEREQWRANALEYVARTDISSLADKAVQIIESITR